MLYENVSDLYQHSREHQKDGPLRNEWILENMLSEPLSVEKWVLRAFASAGGLFRGRGGWRMSLGVILRHGTRHVGEEKVVTRRPPPAPRSKKGLHKLASP